MRKTLLLATFITLGILNGFSQSKKNDLKLTISGLPLFGSSEDFSSGFNGFVLKPTIGYYISDKTSIVFLCSLNGYNFSFKGCAFKSLTATKPFQF